MSYNGWSNYETWNFNLWISNDEGSDSYWRERAQEAFDEAEASEYLTRDEEAASNLEEMMKEEAEEMAESANLTGPMGDLLTHAVGMIDFREIALSWIEDVDKTEEVEE